MSTRRSTQIHRLPQARHVARAGGIDPAGFGVCVIIACAAFLVLAVNADPQMLFAVMTGLALTLGFVGIGALLSKFA